MAKKRLLHHHQKEEEKGILSESGSLLSGRAQEGIWLHFSLSVDREPENDDQDDLQKFGRIILI